MPATPRRIDPVRSLFEYTVEGKGEFPFDMLRYDQCWLKRSAEDVVNRPSSRFPHPRNPTGHAVGFNSPTEDRWRHSAGKSSKTSQS